jgi:MFS family permease
VKRDLVRIYYGFQIFFSLLLWIPIFYEYQKRIGLTDAQIFTIQSIYYTVFCLLEIPTGLLADALGYRFSMRLGALVLVAANLLPIFFFTYTAFLVHFLLIALSRSLISGASSAYLYDCLKAQGGSSAEYKAIEGNSRSYGLIGKVLIWPLIGFLMEWKLTLPYTLTAIGSVIAVICAYLLPPDQKPEGDEKKQKTGFLRELGELLWVLPRMPIIPLLMLQGLGAFILPRILQTNLFQPILSSKGVPVSSYGVWLAAASVFEAVGSGYPAMKATLKRVSEWSAVSLLSLILALTLALIPLSGKVGTLACLMAFSLAAGMIFPVQKQLMNDAISLSAEASRYRATVLSMESIFDRAVCAWVVGGIGIYMSRGEMNEFLYLSAGFCAIGVLSLAGVNRWVTNVLTSPQRSSSSS